MTATKQELLQVKLEFGHKASCRIRPTPDGFTHDWVVFVRGQDDKDISHFVEKVVFNLHESFQKPKRVLKEPPYKVEEHGYGSFSLPIDVYFKNKEQPKTVRIDYDLFLPAFGNPSIHNNRTEALKFVNPPDEFKKKVLKSGGEMLSSFNGSNSSPPTASQATINGNTSHNHSLNNGKEMKHPPPNGETEKAKKTKPEKQVMKTSNTGNKVPASHSGKRSSDDDEVLPKVKKKKKKVEDNTQSQMNSKPSGFIPIGPPAAGTEEEHTIGNNKDVKLKIKSLSKTSKKSMKPTDKTINKIKEKKKDKLNDSAVSNVTNTNVNVSMNGDNGKKKSTSNGSKSKEKSSKSPTEAKPKSTKQGERKVEKLMFRRESGDSWSSSSTSANSPGIPGMGSTNGNKNNALGTLMAELSDQDDDDDDDEDIDISTPFQSDSLTPKSDSFPMSNNNVVNMKDSKPSKGKTKTKEKKDSKCVSHSSKNVSMKSPSSLSKSVEPSKSSSKPSSKSKPKSTKNGTTGHQVPKTDLIHLHKELTSLTDSNSLQQVVDILEHSGCFIITETNFEFDLFRLDTPTIQQIQKCVKR